MLNREVAAGFVRKCFRAERNEFLRVAHPVQSSEQQRAGLQKEALKACVYNIFGGLAEHVWTVLHTQRIASDTFGAR